jgi:polyisoprenoid-binding protein YceI
MMKSLLHRRTAIGLFASALLIGGVLVGTTSQTPIEAQPAATAAVTEYNIDAVHTSVVFRVIHFNVAPFYGRFNKVSGSLKWNSNNLEGSAIHVDIDSASVDTANEKRDQHLRSADFFNSAEFPTITFRSKSIAQISGNQYVVTGDLSFNGTTREVTAPFELVGQAPDMRGIERIGGEAIFTLNRADYGVTYMPDGLSNEVRVIVAIEGIKKQ